MMNDVVAFVGDRRVASGSLGLVVERVKAVLDDGAEGGVLVFDGVTCRQVEVDWRGSRAEVLERLESSAGLVSVSASSEGEAVERRGRGRPKLGVVAREVTLLPRHWEWLGSQPGGASVALRRLVEEARKGSGAADRKREAQEAAYRFVTVMAGDLPGYEEVLRAMYAGNWEGFEEFTKGWPGDVREFARELGRRAVE